jgi:hypothetical protein
MAVNPGQEIQITLYWQALAPMEENYSVYLHLFGKDGQKIGFRDSHAGMGKYPTSRWRVGEVIKDTYMLPVSPEAQGPFAAWLEVGVYSYPRMERLPARDGQGRRVGRTILTRIKIRGPNASLNAAQRLEIPLEGGIRLLGVAVPTKEVAPGEVFLITLFWEAAPLDEDYHVLVHLDHENGLLLGQGDGPPLEGGYPTRFWETGEVLADPHWVRVDENAPPGQATLYVGLYSLQDGHRLAVLGDSAPDNRIPVAQIQVRLP